MRGNISASYSHDLNAEYKLSFFSHRFYRWSFISMLRDAARVSLGMRKINAIQRDAGRHRRLSAYFAVIRMKKKIISLLHKW